MNEVPVEPEWVDPAVGASTVRHLAAGLECSPVLAGVLASRGYTDPTAAERVLDPSPAAIHPPGGLPDVDIAVERLGAALDRGEPIAVFGDRDVDGATGTAVLTRLSREFGATPTVRIPGKWDGYGLGSADVAALADAGAELLLTVDCGTTAVAAIDEATDAGIDVLVVDHHDPDDALPDATACVNPRRADSTYANPDLAAGALAWKVGQALIERRDPLAIETYHAWALPLAAVATCGDYMRLTPENRAIVREGVGRLADCPLPGLAQMAIHCGVESASDVRWSFVPLLNAAQEAESGELML